LLMNAQAGPINGFNAYRKATGPCDRMAMSPTPGDGHFNLMLAGKTMLATPDSGYKLTSIGRTCMLVDGKGQYGDIGYPMSISDFIYRGQEIQTAHWNSQTNEGHMRMWLQPSYNESSGVVFYTRDFFIKPKSLRVRDRV